MDKIKYLNSRSRVSAEKIYDIGDSDNVIRINYTLEYKVTYKFWLWRKEMWLPVCSILHYFFTDTENSPFNPIYLLLEKRKFNNETNKLKRNPFYEIV